MADTENLYMTIANDGSMVDAMNAVAPAFGSPFQILDPTQQKNNIAKAYRAPSSWVNVDTNTNIRPDFTRYDYEYYRPDEGVPSKAREIMAKCNMAYKRNGLIRNIIDLMGDFACQGIKVYHPNPGIQKFYEAWFKRVNGVMVTERFLNNLYRLGNVVVKRQTAKLKASLVEDFKTVAAPKQLERKDVRVNVERMEIPCKYTFVNPMSLTVINEELCGFVGEYVFAIKLDFNLVQAIRNPAPGTAHLVEKIPEDIRSQIATGLIDAIILDPETISVYHYKKDDWEIWADPIIASVLKDIMLLEKTKLADLTALDGAISNVRIWKLGSLADKIMPTPNATARLSNILTNHVGGGTIDIIWGPDIELVESKSNIYQYLNPQKYDATLNSIYAALGIPPTLTGTASASGFTNNYISLKTLIERLEYGRKQVLDFWNKEILKVQKAMGFRKPAIVRFDRMTLSDEASEKALLVQLLHSDVMSGETVLERFGEMPELERARLKKEYRQRENDQLPQKAGAYHNPQHKNDLEKIFAQSGQVAPSQLGVELKPKKKGEMTPLDLENEMIDKQHKVQMEQLEKQHVMQKDKSTFDMKNKDKDVEVMNKEMELNDNKGKLERIKLEKMKFKPKGTPGGNGRPKNKKDSTKRKQKVVKPRTSAEDTTTETDGV